MQWLGAIRQQAITWAIIDLDLFWYMASLVHNELKMGTHKIYKDT